MHRSIVWDQAEAEPDCEIPSDDEESEKNRERDERKDFTWRTPNEGKEPW